MNNEFCGELQYEGQLYHVSWNPNDGLVWLSKPHMPEWGFTNVGQVKGVPKNQAMEIALEMLKHGGIR